MRLSCLFDRAKRVSTHQTVAESTGRRIVPTANHDGKTRLWRWGVPPRGPRAVQRTTRLPVCRSSASPPGSRALAWVSPLALQASRYNKLASLHIYSDAAGRTVAGRVQMSNGRVVRSVLGARCPRCDRTRCLSPADDHYGPDLYCLLCGWHGVVDESGQPVELDRTAPFIGRKRRRRRKPAAASTPDSRAS